VRPIFLHNDDRINALNSIVGLALLVFGLIEADLKRAIHPKQHLPGLLPGGVGALIRWHPHQGTGAPSGATGAAVAPTRDLRRRLLLRQQPQHQRRTLRGTQRRLLRHHQPPGCNQVLTQDDPKQPGARQDQSTSSPDSMTGRFQPVIDVEDEDGCDEPVMAALGSRGCAVTDAYCFTTVRCSAFLGTSSPTERG
jgi:hypothetical protein